MRKRIEELKRRAKALKPIEIAACVLFSPVIVTIVAAIACYAILNAAVSGAARLAGADVDNEY